jgi:membrane-associated phospholipid phosphatase
MKSLKKVYKCILFITGCILFYTSSLAQNWDINLLKKINPENPNSTLMRGLSSSAYPISVATPATLLAVGFIKKDEQLQYKGWQAAGALAIDVALTAALKYTINRDRPAEKYPNEVFPYSIDNDPSFPSTHTSVAFATATTLSLEFKKWYVAVPAYLWAAGVGYSRIYLGEHYPSDVIAGAVVGAGSAFLSEWLTKKILKPKK